MKIKPLYIYVGIITLAVILLVVFTSNSEKQTTNMAGQMPQDEIHKGLSHPGMGGPSGTNVSEEVKKKMEILRTEYEFNKHDTLKAREYADFLAAAHKLDEAIIYYIKILKIDPNKKEILFTLSFIYNMKGDFNKAENFTNKILRIDPKDTQAWYNLGAINASKGNKNKAREMWEQILKEYPGSPSADLAKSALTKL